MDGSRKTTGSSNQPPRPGFTKSFHRAFEPFFSNRKNHTAYVVWSQMKMMARNASELSVDISELADSLELSDRTIKREIKRLLDAKIIGKKKRGRGNVYTVPDLDEWVPPMSPTGDTGVTNRKARKGTPVSPTSDTNVPCHSSSQGTPVSPIDDKQGTPMSPTGDTGVTCNTYKEEDSKTNTNTSPAKAPGSSKPQRKKPTTAHHELIAYYVESWERKYGRKCPFRSIDAKKTHELLIACEGCLEDAKAVIDRYMSDQANFYQGHPMAILTAAAVLPRFIAKAAEERDDDNGLLGFRPPDDEDIAVLKNSHRRTS